MATKWHTAGPTHAIPVPRNPSCKVGSLAGTNRLVRRAAEIEAPRQAGEQYGAPPQVLDTAWFLHGRAFLP